MTGEKELRTLLAGMNPVLNPGRYVYCTFAGRVPAGLRPVVTVAEAEGVTAVVEQGEADALGLAYTFPAAWITLRIHSALDAVGLTAAVAARLTLHGIACNVVAGFHHDHLFVAAEHAELAVRVLGELAAESA